MNISISVASWKRGGGGRELEGGGGNICVYLITGSCF